MDMNPSNQRLRRVAFDFVLPASPAIENLRSWRLVLAGDDGLKENFSVPVDANVSQRAVIWVGELLRIFDTLLLTALAPLFGSHRLLFCRPTSRTGTGTGTSWRAGFEMPLLEGHAEETFRVALKGAFVIEEWVRKHPEFRATDTVEREAFFALAEQHALAPLRSFLPQAASTLSVLHAAFELGVPFSHLGGGTYQLGWGAKARRISRSSTDRDSAIGAAGVNRKDVTARLLRTAGLPAPVHELVNTLESAYSAAKRIGWPVVVKPSDAERGEGVQVDVQAEDLDAAFTRAYEHSKAHLVLIERQVPGICYRIFVVAGQLLYAVRRLPIGVYGDGKLTAAQLVEKACESDRRLPPGKRSHLQPIDELALTELVRQGLQIDAVPEAGQFVALRRIESTAWGGVFEDVTSTIHPENLRAALAASALCDLDVAGVDMISCDITVPWHVNGAVINEVNFAPVLGASVISRLHLKTYVTRLLGGDGRIPMEVYVGNAAALIAARQAVNRLRASGLATALTTHEWTEAPDGLPWPMAVDGLHARVRALVLSHQVAALAIVVQTDELVDRDLPLEGVDAVHLVNEEWISCQPEAALQRKRELLRLLQAWQRV